MGGISYSSRDREEARSVRVSQSRDGETLGLSCSGDRQEDHRAQEFQTSLHSTARLHLQNRFLMKTLFKRIELIESKSRQKTSSETACACLRWLKEPRVLRTGQANGGQEVLLRGFELS